MTYTTADVEQAINRVTQDPRERAAMWFMCGAESGCDPNATQQGGGPGRGAWQIETTWDPAARALNPYTAAQDLYTRWNVPGCTAQQGDLWNTNPGQAAFAAARCIGKAGSPYNSSQQATGWGMVLAHVPIFSDFAGGTPAQLVTGVASGVSSSVAKITGAIATLFDQATWIKVALVAGGLLLVIVGAGAALRDTPMAQESRSAARYAALAA